MHKIVIIGRPNVGKSTLFNRLVGKKKAIVDNTPGVTRDWQESDGSLLDLKFTIIDTAGYENRFDESIESKMRFQTEAAIANADVVLFMFDASVGVMGLDLEFANVVRKLDNQNVVCIANKAEGQKFIGGVNEGYKLGFGEPVGISSVHGDGFVDLFDRLRNLFEIVEPKESFDEKGELSLVVVGRPNAGKSTLINTITKDERLIVGPEAGVTRDSISVKYKYKDKLFKLVDTAGMRKKNQVNENIEKLAYEDAKHSIFYAQVVVLLIDITRGIETQDLKIASQVIKEGRSLIIVINKVDLVKNLDERMAIVKNKLYHSLTEVKGVTILYCSAINGRGVYNILEKAVKVFDKWSTRINTSALNNWLADMVEKHPPPLASGRRIKIRYMSQIKVRPPTFYLNVSLPEDLPNSYIKYLTNKLREFFDFDGVPIRMLTRKSTNPYEHLKNKKAHRR